MADLDRHYEIGACVYDVTPEQAEDLFTKIADLVHEHEGMASGGWNSEGSDVLPDPHVELERLRATVARVEALAEAGVGFDMTPTMPGHGVAYVAWQGYIQRLDDAWTDRLRAAIGGGSDA
ncbi:hypothetical protein [Nocardioides bruguierae]|uniref:Uncharacterized protein n=1 Tax=Nocardioides bruguierae TaxID=2945102 RepID=A0A9X2DB76_9ACTN|nr:hypothetical protein [Nocardioides bruguierae]MCM0622490.1 hypothetical protein [Nocardioides bruguierae]